MVSETTPMVLAKGLHTMAWSVCPARAAEVLKGADVEERIRAAATTIHQALIEAELSLVISAGPHERIDTRLAQRNGHRPKVISTVAGGLELRLPKLRAGSFFPSL
jgi:transposase-like protein